MPDSQSARSHQGGEAIGYDAGKRVRGRKRHLLVDTCGLVLRVVVHSASVQDRAGAKLVLSGIREMFPQVGTIWVDGGHVNVVDAGLVGWAAGREGLEIVAVPRNADVNASGCCPAGGWPSGHSPGWDGADGWHGTTSARPRTPKR
ncbi:transposase [Kitasatospora purpeofusca]|uniref:transposase n=1 Tax=Kitasatospora purpeofusca TaxID=67352 RepID=UPI004064B155